MFGYKKSEATAMPENDENGEGEGGALTTTYTFSPFGPWGPQVQINHTVDPMSDCQTGTFLFMYARELLPGGFSIAGSWSVDSLFLNPISPGSILQAHVRSFELEGYICHECEVVHVEDQKPVVKLIVRPLIKRN